MDPMPAAGVPPDRLTSDQVASVLRRAAELEARSTGADQAEGFTASVVVEAAEEVGLSPAAVRMALAELHTGTLPPAQLTRSRRMLRVGPSGVVESRIVASAPDDVFAAADQYFRRRAFEERRRQDQWVLYRERRDLLTHVRRVVDLGGARQLGGVSGVVVMVSPLADAGTMVRVEATLEPGWRGISATATASGMLAVTGTIAAVTGDPTALLVGVPVGATIGAAGWERRRRWRHRRRDEIGETLAALLDRLDEPSHSPRPRREPV